MSSAADAPVPERIIDKLMFKAFDDNDDDSSDTTFQDPIKYALDVIHFYSSSFFALLLLTHFLIK